MELFAYKATANQDRQQKIWAYQYICVTAYLTTFYCHSATGSKTNFTNVKPLTQLKKTFLKLPSNWVICIRNNVY